jgi:hypothetical protein
MDKDTHIQSVLNHIKQSENSDFKYDEKGITEAYQIQEDNRSNLTIKVLTILGGFIATLAFMGFLFLLGIYRSEASLILFGTIFIIGAIIMNKVYEQLILDTFSVTLYVIGFVLLSMGLGSARVDENIISFLLLIISFSTLFFTQNYILSFISILIFIGSAFSFIPYSDNYNLVHLFIIVLTLILAVVMLYEAKIITAHKKIAKLYNPLRIGLIIAFLSSLVLVGKRYLVHLDYNVNWISSIVIIAVILKVITIILNVLNITKNSHKILILVCSFLILLPSIYSPAISGAILVILLSFRVNHKTGFGLGVIAFIYFISQYYYDLNFTLLVKSIVLFVTGILFIVFYLFTYKKQSYEKI